MDVDSDITGMGFGGGDSLGSRNDEMKMEADDRDDMTPAPTPARAESGDSSGDDPIVIGFSKARKRPAGFDENVECIDLTKEDNNSYDDGDLEEEDSEDDEMASNSTEEEVQVKVENQDNTIPDLIEVEPISKKELAEDRRKLGNDHFKRAEYNQALLMYTKAIEFVPTEASYYGNRSACYMMQKKFAEAFADTRASIQLDSKYEKGYLRLIRITLALGDVNACQSAIEMAVDRGLLQEDIVKDEKRKLAELKQYKAEIENSKKRQDYRKLVYLCERALEYACGDLKLKIVKADALTKLGRYNDAGELCTEILQTELHCVEAICIRALCLYQADNVDKCIQFLQQGLKFAPDNTTCQGLYKKIKQIKEQRETAASLYKSGKFNEAKAIYLNCNNTVSTGELKNISIESKLQFNLALITHKIRSYDESIKFVTRAIELNPNYFKAFVHRAIVHSAKEMYEESVRDYEAALKLDPTKRELKNDLQNAKMAAKRAKRKDYYKILDVNRNASDDDIRKAYKKRAMMHHPDRHASATEDVQKEQEKHFKDIGEAYEVLSDPKKRIRYDQGQDLTDSPDGGGSYYDPYEANHIFNMFFTNGGTGGGGMGSTRGGSSRYHQFGRPGAGCGFHRQ